MTGSLDCFSMYSEQDAIFPLRKPRQVHWSIVWSDIMMTMFIMFAVLYIYQAANRDLRYGGSGKTQSAAARGRKSKDRPPEEKKQMSDELSELRLEMMKSQEQPMEKVRLRNIERHGPNKINGR